MARSWRYLSCPRADRDLKSHDNQGAVIPNPDGDDKPVEVDLVKGTARIRRK